MSTEIDKSLTCRFLALPLELRLQIYDLVLEYSPATVTFSTARLTGSQPDIIHRLYGDNRAPCFALPEYHIPVVEPRYEASLLSLVRPAQINASSRIRSEELGICDYSPRPALLLVNHQIHEEMMQNTRGSRRRELSLFSLFIAFPHGLQVFRSIGTHLLPGARTLQIAGEYSNSSFCASRAAKVTVTSPDSPNTAAIDSADHLGALISQVLGPRPRITQLQLRIYYPGPNSYSAVWGDDCSPTVVALRNIFAGDIQIEVWRGPAGTGVYLVARPSTDGKRNVSTSWRKLDNGDGRYWVIDPAWPNALKRT